MKRYILTIAAMAMSVALLAVPARRGFHDYTLQDGSSIQLTLAGDEFAHWYEAADGTIYHQNEDGTFSPTSKTRTDMNNRRKSSAMYKSTQARRTRQDVGTTPNLAPKGVVILANFSDSKMQTGHTQAVFDELCNSLSCTVNSGYPSAGQYFADQSNGSYRPQFDVFGPVTLSRAVSYYGKDNEGEDEGDDQHPTDAVVEACILANQQFTINWADYDSDNDGYVDFVYVIYAGKGQADGGSSNTIWPHNWDVTSAIHYGYCTYTNAQRTISGKKIDNYAMSSELSGNAMGGIGTLCHEFGHVMGLPDLYDIEYEAVYKSKVTPNDWNIMDGGSYNADGHCPPNYDPWQKDFFGWLKPINLGNEGQNLTLYANGTENYQTYQINASGTYVSPTTSGLRYYIENRQAQGWDAPLTGHGMLIWKINFNSSAWEANSPNASSTTGAPLYTIVSATGTKVGWDGSNDNCPKNPFPGSGKKTSWNGVSGKPLLNISEENGVVTLTYIDEPAEVVEPFELTWMVGSTEFTTTTSTNTGKIVLPVDEPEACDASKVFVGWTRSANYSSAILAPELVKTGDAAQEGDIFYAVFAKETVSASEPISTKYTFTSKAWADPTDSWTSIKDGNQLTAGQGVQVTAALSGAGATCVSSFNNVSKIVVEYCTNSKSGAGSISVQVGESLETKSATKNGGTSLRDLQFDYANASGDVTLTVNCTTNSIYVNSVTITSGVAGVSYSDFTTSCSNAPSAVENTAVQPAAVKAIRNGQVVIIRDGHVFNLLGVQQ